MPDRPADDRPADNAPIASRRTLPQDLCACLRTKTMTMGAHARPTIAEDVGAADTAIYHCIVTMTSHGPDEADVMPGACRPGRRCYTPSHPLT